jgi:hypothetical protein
MPEASGVTVTVYYSPSEGDYSGTPKTIKGWINRLQNTVDVYGSKVNLGTFPTDFLETVKEEGNGRLSSPRSGYGWLNYSHEGMPYPGYGFWLDSAPRGSWGQPLVTMQTAAASNALRNLGFRKGVKFRIVNCGTGATVEACRFYQEPAAWVVADEFTSGLVSASNKQVDLYAGPRDRAFLGSEYWTTMRRATIKTVV